MCSVFIDVTCVVCSLTSHVSCFMLFHMQIQGEFQSLTLIEELPLDMLERNWENRRGKVIEKSIIEHKPAAASLLKLVEPESLSEGNY